MSNPIKLFDTSYTLDKGRSGDKSNAHPIDADEAFQKITPLLKKIGVTRVVDITNWDKIGLPVFNCIKPDIDYYSVAHGKGVTASSSKMSACMECIERYYGVNGSPESIYGSFDELVNKYPLVDFEDIHTSKHSIFNKNMKVEWVLGWDIMYNRPYYYPKGLVCLKRDTNSLEESFFLFLSTSNGLSGGLYMLEAILQGLYEVIERDAWAVGDLAVKQDIKKLLPKNIALNSIKSPQIKALLDAISKANVNCYIHDITTDVKVPSFRCSLIEKSKFATGGYGSSLDWEVAMSRAITEAAQARTIFQASVRDVFSNDDFQQLLMSSSLTYDETSVLNVDYPKCEFENFEDEIHHLLSMLKLLNIDKVLVFPLTEPEHIVQVVKVVVPKLENASEFLFFQPRQRWDNLKVNNLN